MAKLHELLAVEGSLSTQSTKVRTDLAGTFANKRHLFEEKRVTFKPFSEDQVEKVEEQSAIQSTVEQELEWVSQHIIKSLDASLQVAVANTAAKADIVLEDGLEVLAEDVPVTALLELEKRMAEVFELTKSIPTLDPAKGYTQDGTRSGVYVAREVSKNRTNKTKEVVVLYPATKEHPAQTQLLDVDKPVGTISEQHWSALLTPQRKSEIMDRAEQLIRAVRRARSRANDVEVDLSKKIGKSLLNFVIHGKGDE
jgi:hypothetical protein